jgi:ribosome-binding factor A
MVSKNRIIRISERIRRELSNILLIESNDPRLKGVTVTEVDVDKELAYADIYVCALEGTQRSHEVLTGLEHAQGYLRSELAHRMDLRVFPRLRFHWDATFEHADQIERLLVTINKTDVTFMNNEKQNRVVKKDERA